MVLAKTRFLPSLQPPTNPVFGGAPDRGAVGTVAQPLFTEHLLAFELTSILLLAAIVGAVALGKRRTANAGTVT
jgi:NADH:ubiquinone oxidoreductase subunit 6 (subunit J)